MVEDLLHAKIVLSKKQLQDLLIFGPTHQVYKDIGTITFLGLVFDYREGNTINLLIRFEEYEYLYPMLPILIARVFGEKYQWASGNGDGRLSMRAIVTTTTKRQLRNPFGFIKGKAKQFARELVDYYHSESNQRQEATITEKLEDALHDSRLDKV